MSNFMTKAVVTQSTALPHSAHSVAGEDGVEVVDPADTGVGEGVDQEDGGISRPPHLVQGELRSLELGQSHISRETISNV